MDALVGDLDAVVWEADARTATFTFVSGAAERISGWSASKWLERPGFFAEHLDPGDRERVLAAILDAGGGRPLDVEYRFLAPDGSVRWLRTIGHRAADPADAQRELVRALTVDITEARLDEEAREETDLRFRRVVERLPAVVYLESATPDAEGPGALVYVSPQLQSILGFSPEEWLAAPTSWADQLHPDDRDRVRAINEDATERQAPFVADYRMFGRDGRIRWIHDEAILIQDDDGNPRFWQGTMQDITAQREGEAHAQQSDARYRTLVEQLPAIIYIEDITGDGLQIVYINSQVKELLGIEPEEWIADPSVWSGAIHPDDVDHVMELNRHTERTGEPFSVEYRMIARDGRLVWFEDEARLVYGPDGEPAAWQGVMVDITARKQAEAQLAETEARYRALVEQQPTITYMAALGRGTGVLYISPQTEQLLGYSPHDWYEDPGLWDRIVHPDDRERSVHPDPSVGQHDQRYRVFARDGREVWVHDLARLILDEDGEPMFWQGVLVDLTEQRRAETLEADLATERSTSEQLRVADALKSTFLQAVSHDLRSPLSAILGLARTLEREDIKLTPEESRTMAGRIAFNARRLDGIVGDLLDLERLAAGALEPMFAPVDVGALVRELVAGADLVGGRRLHLDTAPLTITADAAMVERIAENLVANAAKHTPGDARIWISVERADAGALIVVEDDGPGVPREDREIIFEAFAQGGSSHAGGAGVGLALVARFAELHGGRAWVQERKGGGASFRVLLSIDPSRGRARSDQPAVDDAASEANQA
jgi:PAS domain S-box-containing protein